MNKNVLISSNYNSLYFQFVPLVASIWRHWGFNPILTLVTDKSYNEWKWLEEYAEVRPWEIRKDLNEGIWSKVARIVTYPEPANEKQMVSDIDMIPLNKEYFEKLFTYDDEKIVLASADSHWKQSHDRSNVIIKNDETHIHNKFAGCYMVAKGNIWKEIINPNDLNINDLLTSWKGINKFDQQEDILAPYDVFSEESLCRRLVYDWNYDMSKQIRLQRGWHHGRALNRLDRAVWNLDKAKLDRGEYIDCHSLRPLQTHKSTIMHLVNHLGVDPELMEIGIRKSKENG